MAFGVDNSSAERIGAHGTAALYALRRVNDSQQFSAHTSADVLMCAIDPALVLWRSGGRGAAWVCLGETRYAERLLNRLGFGRYCGRAHHELNRRVQLQRMGSRDKRDADRAVLGFVRAGRFRRLWNRIVTRIGAGRLVLALCVQFERQSRGKCEIRRKCRGNRADAQDGW